MTSNEQLKLAYASFCLKVPGPGYRIKFSKMLDLPVTETNRTPTLDKWLLEPDNQNYRQCPWQVSRLARLLILLAEVLPTLDHGTAITNQQFWLLENLCTPGWANQKENTI